MHAKIAFHGLSRNPAVEACVNRWLARIEQAHSVTSCEVHLTRNVRFLGTRTRIDLAITAGSDTVALERETWIDDLGDLYVLVSNAFRDARQRLVAASALHVA